MQSYIFWDLPEHWHVAYGIYSDTYDHDPETQAWRTVHVYSALTYSEADEVCEVLHSLLIALQRLAITDV